MLLKGANVNSVGEDVSGVVDVLLSDMHWQPAVSAPEHNCICVPCIILRSAVHHAVYQCMACSRRHACNLSSLLLHQTYAIPVKIRHCATGIPMHWCAHCMTGLTGACLQGGYPGDTVLHYAASKHALDVVELLLLLGANVHATNAKVSSLSQQDRQHWQAFPSTFMPLLLLVYAMHQVSTPTR